MQRASDSRVWRPLSVRKVISKMSILTKPPTGKRHWGPLPHSPETTDIEIYFDENGREIGSINEFGGDWSASSIAAGGIFNCFTSPQDARKEVERLTAGKSQLKERLEQSFKLYGSGRAPVQDVLLAYLDYTTALEEELDKINRPSGPITDPIDGARFNVPMHCSDRGED